MCIAIAFLFIKKTAAYVNPAFLASISLIISGLLTYVVFLISDKQQVKLFNKAVFKLIVYAAVTFAAFELTSFTALAIGEASRVTPVSQSSMIFTLMGGYIFLNEKTNRLYSYCSRHWSTLFCLNSLLRLWAYLIKPLLFVKL